MRRESLERRVSQAKQFPTVNRMKTTRIYCFMKTWFVFALLIEVTLIVSGSEKCQEPNTDASVTENAENGTMLLKINYTQGQNWKIFTATPPGYFRIDKGNTSFYLVAAKTLDLEELKEKASSMSVSLECTAPNEAPTRYTVFITLKPSNEFKPTFTESVYKRSISENARIGDSVFLASNYAEDKDYHDKMTFDVLRYPQRKNQFDGIASGKFNMADQTKGLIVVNGHLDFEEQKYYEIQIVVKDTYGNQSLTKLKINISDVDDLDPIFLPNPCTTKENQCQIPVFYHGQIKATDKGQISILPNAVKAVDMEINNYNISYSFTHGEPTNIEKYFKIDTQKAIITKEEDLPKNVTSPINLFIKAEELSPLKHSSVAILMINILDRNSTIVVSSTKPPDSISVSMIQGYSSLVFYGVLIPLMIIVAALILCIVIILVKSKKTRASDDSNYKADKPFASSVIIQTTNSLLFRTSKKETNRTSMEVIENSMLGVINPAFVPDKFSESGGEDRDNKKLEKVSTTSMEDNDVHPRSLHSNHYVDGVGYNLKSANIYPTIEDLCKAGIEEGDIARDGDIGKNYSKDTNSKDGTDQLISDTSELQNDLTDENESDKAKQKNSEPITDTCLEEELEQEIPAPDYVSDDAQSPCESKESTWVVPRTSGQLESEISEFLLTPDFIKNVGEASVPSKSLSAPVDFQTEVPLKSSGTADGNNSDSILITEKDQINQNEDDNTLPVWASEALKPTISSKEEFKSHLESLMSSPPQLPPPSKTFPPPLPSSSSLPSLTPSPSSQSLITTPKGKAPEIPPPPPPPPLPSQLPSTSIPSSSMPPKSPLPPQLPPIQIMATQL